MTTNQEAGEAVVNSVGVFWDSVWNFVTDHRLEAIPLPVPKGVKFGLEAFGFAIGAGLSGTGG